MSLLLDALRRSEVPSAIATQPATTEPTAPTDPTGAAFDSPFGSPLDSPSASPFGGPTSADVAGHAGAREAANRLLNATPPPVDPARRRMQWLAAAAALVLLPMVGWLGWMYWEAEQTPVLAIAPKINGNYSAPYRA